MPLSDLFKKSPKKDPDKNNPLGTPEMQKKRYDAAMEFVKELQEKLPLVRGKPHAGSVLSIAARIAGTSLYRSMNYKNDTAPGVVVLSEEVNQAWPQLMNLFAFYCKQNGFDVMSKPVVTEFPEKDKPLMTVEQVQTEYQDQYHEIMKKYGLDHLNSARAGMVVCSIVFQYHCKTVKDIDPHVAAGIVAMGIVEGAKTAPPPFGAPKRPTSDKNNNRLVLGEDALVLQETRDNGGIAIVVNPGVVKALQQGNIDPYMIYEKALMNQIEAKIPTIDFIGPDVDDLIKQWRGKPQTQIPIHVRLVLWLKENAKVHGYEQSGNSWVLRS
jgi:hypothetical protein